MTKHQPNHTGIEPFLIRYRKLLRVMSCIVLLYLPFKIYNAPGLNPAHIFQGVGYWLDTIIVYVAVPVYLLIYTRKLHRENEAFINQNKDNGDNSLHSA
jgi:hypothetical protein